MILGNSAFIFRDKKTKEFLSKNLVEVNKVEPIRVDISFLVLHTTFIYDDCS